MRRSAAPCASPRSRPGIAGRLGSLGAACALLAYPQLREAPPGERAQVLAAARQAELSVAEWIGMVGGTGAVAGLLRYGSGELAAYPLPLLYFVQFAVAAPLLGLVVGPFLLCRTRRGIARALALRGKDES